MTPANPSVMKHHTQYPPFSYGPLDASTNTFPMVPENAAPALVVWLFLVTSVDFLNALDGAPGTNPDLVNAEDIGTATNLTPATVNQIFDSYRKGSADLQDACHRVADAFQAFAQDPGGYDRSNYPNGPVGAGGVQSTLGKKVLAALATSGAGVNPLPPNA